MNRQYAIIFCFILALCGTARGQNSVLNDIKWQKGPAMGELGNIAKINIPEGYVFAGASDTRRIMESMQNPTSGRELGFIAPASLDWFTVFEFDSTGYIRDDEKNSLDANAMLESFKKGTEASNKERLRRGWKTMSILGWEQSPRYNETTHNLEWAIRGESDGSLVINYNTRLLGREGVMRVTLVTDPASLASTMPDFKNVLAGYDFKQGKKYSEFRKGDKVAEYGLAALVVGGATAVAVKTGMFKWIWKVLVVGGIALIGFFKSLFSRKKSQ